MAGRMAHSLNHSIRSGQKSHDLDKETSIGYKVHADVTDCCLPISLALTAASLHDSQAAIPLMKLTSARVDYLYDLMDAAYDAQPIYAVSRSLGHVPIIDKNGRGARLSRWRPTRRPGTRNGRWRSSSTAA
jgi:hypothetical protein